MKNFKFLSLMLMLCMGFALTACSDSDDRDDDPENVSSTEAALVGKWKCTDCDVTKIKAYGIELPDYLKDIIVDKIENEMIGYVMTIPPFSTGQVKFEDNVLIVSGSSIKYKVTKLTDKHMEVKYNTSSSVDGFSIEMSIEAEFDKIK